MKQIAIRFPEEIIQRLDAYAAVRMEKEPGLVVRRADAARKAINIGLEQLEQSDA